MEPREIEPRKMKLRKDELTESWVCISPLRGLRPFSFEESATAATDDIQQCPFCLSNRHMTPEETAAYKKVRVIPNKYPALDVSTISGYGFHEVLIDSPDHRYTLANGDVSDVVDTLLCLQQRLNHFAKDEKIQYVQIFKNQGFDAGASIFHSHWQIMALPFVPSVKETMFANFQKHENESGCCFLCETSGNLDGLIVFEVGDVVVYCPRAALHYYGVNIMTKSHADFTHMNESALADIAAAMQTVLKALNARLPNLSYNICLHQAPFNRDGKHDPKHWHFYMQIIPRKLNYAGFELSTGCYINSLDPKEAAQMLRDIILKRC